MDLLSLYARSQPDKPAVVDDRPGTDPVVWSFAELDRRANQLARLLLSLDADSDTKVIWCGQNSAALLAGFHAIRKAGAVGVPLNYRLTPDEAAYVIDNSDSAIVYVDEEYRGLVEAVRDRTPKVRHVLVFDGDGSLERRIESMPDTPPSSSGDEQPDVAGKTMIYTSGTTGKPKGCVLSNDYFLRAGTWYAAIGGLCTLRPGDRLITPLPLNHMNAMAFSTMAMILTGGAIVQLDRFHPSGWWDAVRESAASIVHYLGVMPSMLLGAPPDPRDRAHRVRFGFGAGVDRRHHGAFEQRFGFPLLEAWAMTETGAGAVVIANREPRHVGTNCFGRPEPAVETRILPQDGELLVRAAGPEPRAGFFTCYLKDTEATEAAWEGGWFHTGDIVRADAGGHLYFVDRKKNIIRRSGENISAVEVESVLRRDPLVAEVAVAAAPDPIREEEVMACIVARQPLADPAEAAARIVRAALQELSYFKVPGWIAFMDALPITASQKIARGTLKSVAEDLLARGACIDTRALKRRGGEA